MDEKGCVTRCAFERAAEVEFRALNVSVQELKGRMRHLEVTLSRGLMLLVANLAGMVVMLGVQLMS